MSTKRRTAFLTTSGVALVAAVSACGSPITANHDWRTLDAQVTITEHVGPSTVSGVALGGRLVDAKGKIVPNTVFTEECAHVTGAQATSWRCLAFINTGVKIYLAGGVTSGPFGKLTNVYGGVAAGSFTITKLSGGQTATQPLLVRISATKS
jgi:hypothetical protein